MKKIKYVFSFILIAAAVYGQPKSEIIGKVYDQGTGDPVFYVNVFLANTTIGTTTDKDGNFHIVNVPPGIFNLIIQHVGYELEVKQIQLSIPKDINIDIEIRKKVIPGTEIEIVADEPIEWRNNYSEFKLMFIGNTENAKLTEINNPENLSFNFDSTKNIFKAHADSPLLIENRALGYRIQLLLRSFSFSGTGGRYRYFSKFDFLDPIDEKESKTWVENRRKTFEGSLRHFLSCVARNKLNESGFGIYGGKFHISSDSTYIRKVFFKDELWITFKDKNTSAIQMNHDFALIDQLGNLISPLSITKSGDWYNERIADLLPWDYQPPSDSSNQ